MFLKNKWSGIGIKKKLFVISTAILVITSIVTYTILFFAAPKIYSVSKKNSIEKATNEIMNFLSNEKDDDYTNTLNQYAYKNESFVFITNSTGEIVYSSNNSLIAKNRMDHLKKVANGLKVREGDIEFNKVFYFKTLDQYCNLKIISPNRMKDDIQKIMLIMLPIIALITLGIGILAQYIYSKVISKPLGNINEVARNIANLNFGTKLNYSGKDEIAQLSRSINSISYNLQKTIKDLKKANRSLVNDIEKEKLQDKRRRDFLNAISHELKTPITVINGQIEGMLYNIGPYKNRDKYLSESLESLEELRTLVQEIINLAKYEEGLIITYKKINLNNLINDIVYGHDYFKNEKSLRINIIDEGVIDVVGDENIIKKIFSNLINNSVKYSKEDTDIIIEILETRSVRIINSVEDSECLDKDLLFKAFYRGDESRSKEISGSGLGLYIVKTLVEIHDNIDYDIEIENNKFIFEINFLKNIEEANLNS